MDTSKEDILIVLGDVGLNYYGGRCDRIRKMLVEALPITMLCIHGNHEQRLELYPETYGAMGETYEKLLAEAGVTRLVNSAQINEVYGIEVVGCQVDRRFYKRFKRVNKRKL